MLKQFVLLVALPACTALSAAGAQTIPGAVLARNEPHHHPAYEDSLVRVLRVDVPGHDTTLLHEHGPDYFWIALGASEVINVRLGQPDATIRSADLSMHYTVGRFAHVARNPGTKAFRNITVELLRSQTNVQNLCEEVVAGAPLICTSTRVYRGLGVLERPMFETDQLRVSLLTLDAGGKLDGPRTPGSRLYITLNPLDATVLHARPEGPMRVAAARPGVEWSGGAWLASADGTWQLSNGSSRAIEVIEVTAKRR